MHKVEMADLLLSILREAPLGIIALDLTGKVIVCNKKALDTLNVNCKLNSVVGEQLITYTEHLPDLTDWVTSLQINASLHLKKEFRINKKKLVLLKSRPFIGGFILAFQDITELENRRILLEEKSLQLEAALKESQFRAEFDYLTEIPNRYNFITQAETILESLTLSQSADLIFVDLKDFDQINDTLGHHAGDDLLRYVSHKLKTFCEANNDLYARLGGDEFCILHIHHNEADWSRQEYTTKLQRYISQPAEISGFMTATTCSIGVSTYPKDALTLSNLFKCADIACKQSKKIGNMVIYDDSLNTLSHYRLKLAHDAKKALTNNEFVLYLQPKLDLTQQKITACEALIRWNHPEYGLIMPNDFIPMVERSDLVHDLVFKVLEMAMLQIIELEHRIHISVNFSPKNLFTPDLVNRTRKLLEKYHVNPKCLCIEFTETALMETGESTRSILFDLQQLGIKLSLDDYGTGYSSLSHMQSLPINQIKIDSSFVSNMHKSHKDQLIVNSTVQLAKNLGLEVVVEGVEQQEHMDMLLVMGCHIVQGYHISKPRPINEIKTFIANYCYS